MKCPASFRWLIGCAFVIDSLTAHAAANPVNVTPPFSVSSTVAPSPVEQTKREAALTVAHMLPDPAFVSSLNEEFDKTPQVSEKTASLQAVLDRYQAKHKEGSAQAGTNANANAQENPTQDLRRLDRSLLEYKGIQHLSSGLLQVRLYEPAGQPGASDEFSRMLVAFEPSGDDKQWSVVEAYDSQGNVYQLDARQPPSFPVLVVGLDAKEDVRAGLIIANQLLASRGLQAASPTTRRVPANAHSGDYADTAKLDRISLKVDNEPWVAGAAEVYALVSGLQPEQAKAQIELVDMPYLQYDTTIYTPNKIVIYWGDYRYGAANVLLYEHDDNTNYKDLALALANAVEAILGAIKPEYAMIAAVAKAVLEAMPNSWFENNDDYLDSFYTLEKNRTYTDYVGAANNAEITLTPYRLRDD
jgi:Protein of unknown function (DUF3103)